jgi:hypothetical protein
MTPKINTNKIYLAAERGTTMFSHFTLDEFQNSEGWAMVSRELLQALEAIRQTIWDTLKTEHAIQITRATVTEEENRALAARLGWTDEGGKVARDSHHLAKYGGAAADIVAYNLKTKAILPANILAKISSLYVPTVIPYPDDNHVHISVLKRNP